MQFRLRTLLIVMLLSGPLASAGWNGWQAYQRSQRTACAPSLKQLKIAIHNYYNTPPLPPNQPVLGSTPVVSE